jgi:hypothetical protein
LLKGVKKEMMAFSFAAAGNEKKSSLVKEKNLTKYQRSREANS